VKVSLKSGGYSESLVEATVKASLEATVKVSLVSGGGYGVATVCSD